MKRSEAIKKLTHKVISHTEVVTHDNWVNGVYEDRAERLLKFIEEELGMLPPFVDGIIDPLNYMNLVVDQARYSGQCEWEPEDV